ncbi:MAG: hypothetical protein EON60_01055 [Alphaproteobacteria bacterium]|nr:MAG: hypothetical protein EON60_01055 [Alphaproteobacteria bacterium]
MTVYQSNSHHHSQAGGKSPKPADDIPFRNKLVGYSIAIIVAVAVIGGILYLGTQPISYNAIKAKMSETYQDITN